MAGFTLSERIQATPQDVFAFLTTVENAAKALPEVKKTEKLGKRALDVGTRYLQVRHSGGREYSAEYEVLELDGPTIYTVTTVQEGIQATYRYKLEPLGGSTLIHLECEVLGVGIKKLLAWIVARAMQRDDAAILAKLREAIKGQQGS